MEPQLLLSSDTVELRSRWGCASNRTLLEIRSQIPGSWDVVAGMGNVPHRPLYLNTWSPAGGAVSGGCEALGTGGTADRASEG